MGDGTSLTLGSETAIERGGHAVVPASQTSGRSRSGPRWVLPVCVLQLPPPRHLVYSLVCDTDGDYVIILLWGPWHICRAQAHLLCCVGNRPAPQMLH